MIEKTLIRKQVRHQHIVDDVYYIVIYKNGVPLFEIDNNGLYQDINSLVITGYLKAFCSFTEHLVDSSLKYINVGEVSIGFENGIESSIYFIVKHVSEEIQNKMKIILNVFEMQFEGYLKDCSKFSVPANFLPFKDDILQILQSDKIQTHFIPHKNPILTENRSYLIGNQSDLVSLIDGKKTIKEIALLSKFSIKDALIIFETLKHQKTLEFHIEISKDDVFEMLDVGIELLYENNGDIEGVSYHLGEMSRHIVKALNGKRSVNEIAQIYNVPVSDIQQLLGLLLRKGYVAAVRVSISSTLIIERFYESIFENLLNEMSLSSLLNLIDSVFESVDSKLSNLVYYDGNKLCFDLVRKFIHKSNIQSFDIYETFVYSISILFNLLQKQKGEAYVSSLRTNVFEDVNLTLFGM